jgi:hypothetical protein
VQAQQIVTADVHHDADVIAVAAGSGEYCVALMFVRAGRSLGSTTFFPKAPFAEPPEVLAAFVAQYYAGARGAAGDHRRARFRRHGRARGDARRSASGHKVRIASLGARHPRALAGDDAGTMRSRR